MNVFNVGLRKLMTHLQVRVWVRQQPQQLLLRIYVHVKNVPKVKRVVNRQIINVNVVKIVDPCANFTFIFSAIIFILVVVYS